MFVCEIVATLLRVKASLTAPFLALLGSCAIFTEDARPSATLGAEVLDKYVHRGMPQHRTGALQGQLDVTLPTKDGGSLTLGTFGNMDLQDNAGRAWFPDGHAGRFSQIDYVGTWARTFEHVSVAAGLHNYNLPFGQTFPNGPRSSTSELFVHASTELLGARPEVQLRYDFDQAESFYGVLGVSEDFELSEKLTCTVRGSLGYSGTGASEWSYGIREAGFADLHGTLTVTYAFDAKTVIGAHADASTIVDSELDQWFGQIGIPEDNYWAGLFVRWTY